MANKTGVNGVLPVSVLQKNNPSSAPRGPKAAQPKLKLVLRRLPPGLTKSEFEAILGDDWKLGAGKVDWLVYKKGKISRDLAKPSRPSRAYVHVTSQSHVQPFGNFVRQSSFVDAAKSAQDPALIGPPTLDYAPYPRMPGGRRKNDPRQGTIDQDQEFKDFLESLTNPIPKPAAAEGDDQKEAKVTTTPLIEALREKKANKEKPREKAAKHGRGEPKEDTAEKGEKKILSKGTKDASAGSHEKGRRVTKAEKAAKEAVKVLTKEAAAAKESTPSQASDRSATSTPAPERKRGNVSAAKAILQRDLGLSQSSSRRRGAKRDAAPAAAAPATPAKSEEAPAPKAKAKESAPAPSVPAPSEKSAPQSPKKNTRAERRAFKASLADKTNNRTVAEDSKPQAKTATPPAPTILKKPQAAPAPAASKAPAAARAPPTEPAASRAAPQAQPKAEPTNPRPQASAQAPAKAPSAGAGNRQAFLKHANPSQGITEPLIEEALKVFGAIEKVEIDKRKGFAYVDFVEPAGLKNAIDASPVKVAQGAVQVLERKEKVARNRPHPGPHGPPTGPARGRGGGFAGRGRGGRAGGRGGHAAGSDAPSGSAPAAPGSNTGT